MKYQYKLTRNSENKQLTIQEYIKVEGEMPFLACEETYKLENLESTLQEGSHALKSKLRNHNIYPPSRCMTSLVTAAADMLTTANHQNSIEINFDDKEINVRSSHSHDGNKDYDSAEVNKDSVSIDKLLKNSFVETKKMKQVLKSNI